MNCVSSAPPCQGAACHRSHATSRPGVSVQVGLESWRYYQLWALEAWYFGDTTKLLLHIKSQFRYIHIYFFTNAFHFDSFVFNISIILFTNIVTTAPIHFYYSTIDTNIPRYCNKSVFDVGPSFLPTALHWPGCYGVESWAVCCCVVLQTIHRFHNWFSQSLPSVNTCVA